MSELSLTQSKQAMRAEASARRARLSSHDACERIAGNFLGAIPFGADDVVSAYSAMGDEADPLPLLKALHARGLSLALPRVAGPKRTPLVFHKYAPGMQLHRGGFGLMQPAPDWPHAEPTILLVPLLAFDAKGYRLGYGGGYYDKTLSEIRKARNVTAVGFAFAGQEVSSVPHDEFDQRLDWVVTEKEARKLG